MSGPGSGKTTLLKRLARACAIGGAHRREHYPDLPDAFPVFIPIARFDDEADGRTLDNYIRYRMESFGGAELVHAYTSIFNAGTCLFLFDGLDEIASTGKRIHAARSLDDFLQQIGTTRALVTSRPLGYRICRINSASQHARLLPFQPKDVRNFAHQWHRAFERHLHPDRPDTARATTEANSLVDEINANDRVASLASNPLMLTIIALITRHNMTLPERRVELHDIALNTLLRSWHYARKLYYPVHNEPEDDRLADMIKIWSEVAFWMHQHKSSAPAIAPNFTAMSQRSFVGLVSRSTLPNLLQKAT